MILADKIINERKKNGWSQEELAEQLGVSRQSVSKWEGAQAVPDLAKIIAMADIFGVSTDYLLKDDMEPENAPIATTQISETVSSANVKRVSMEEANEYLDISRANAPKIANAVSICILSPVILILLAGLSEMPKFGISETMAAVVGILVLLVMIAVAVYVFIITGAKVKKYEFLETDEIDTAYGVEGLAKERKNTMENRKTTHTAVGVIMCILSCIPLLITACLEMEDYIIVSMVSVLLIIISVAVNMFVRVGIEWGSLEKLLQEGDYTVKNKLLNKKVEKVSGIYWTAVLAGYLAWSFITMKWEITWIVWPIAAVTFGVVTAIIRAISKEN